MKKKSVLCLNSKNTIENEIIKKMFLGVESIAYKELLSSKLIYKDIDQLIIFSINDETINLIEKLKYKVKIKVITDIYEGILFNHKEKDNYLKIIKYLKNKDIYKLYFLKKGIYEAYLSKKYNELIIGAYKHHFNWNNNTVNTLSVARFFDNSILFYNRYDDYIEKDFLDIFNINYKAIDQFKNIDEYVKNISLSSLVLDIEFTNNFNLNFMIAAELRVPCLIGNNNDFFNNLNFKYKDIFITSSEDNPYLNSLKIKDFLNKNNLNKILEELYIWKQKYNKLQKDNIKKVMEE